MIVYKTSLCCCSHFNPSLIILTVSKILTTDMGLAKTKCFGIPRPLIRLKVGCEYLRAAPTLEAKPYAINSGLWTPSNWHFFVLMIPANPSGSHSHWDGSTPGPG